MAARHSRWSVSTPTWMSDGVAYLEWRRAQRGCGRKCCSWSSRKGCQIGVERKQRCMRKQRDECASSLFIPAHRGVRIVSTCTRYSSCASQARMLDIEVPGHTPAIVRRVSVLQMCEGFDCRSVLVRAGVVLGGSSPPRARMKPRGLIVAQK